MFSFAKKKSKKMKRKERKSATPKHLGRTISDSQSKHILEAAAYVKSLSQQTSATGTLGGGTADDVFVALSGYESNPSRPHREWGPHDKGKGAKHWHKEKEGKRMRKMKKMMK